MPGFDPDRPPLQSRAEARMTAEQYKHAIKRLGLSQVRAARFFGYGDRLGQKFATGETRLPPAVEHLLKLMLKHGVLPGDLDRNFK